MEYDLKVPKGISLKGELVSPEDAKKGGDYYCPGCQQRLVLRKGQVNRAHFTHPATSECSGETILHKTAKLLIAEVVNKFIENEISPVIDRTCKTCTTVTKQSLPATLTSAQLERKLSSGFIVDVALMIGDEIVSGIEIKVTHEVDEHKQTNIGLPFLELLADDVINDPMFWIPSIDAYQEYECPCCEKNKKVYWNYLKQISRETNVCLPTSIFRAATRECFRDNCKTEFLIFDWPGRINGNPPPEEKPHTIQYRYSKTTKETTWVDTCPACKTIVGAFFYKSLCLREEPSQFTDESYRLDMTEIATWFMASGWPSYTDRVMALIKASESEL